MKKINEWKINEKDETDAVSDESSKITLELQTCQRKNATGTVMKKKILERIRPLTQNMQTLIMKTAVGAKITKAHVKHW